MSFGSLSLTMSNIRTLGIRALEVLMPTRTNSDACSGFFYSSSITHVPSERCMSRLGFPATRQDEIAYVKLLAHVMHTEPNVKACCRNICKSCISNPIHIHESGKRVNAQFFQRIHHHFVKFAADAIAMHFMCGFVAYYTEKRKGIRLPHTLPLGSFTWSVERMPGDDRVWPFKVKIRGIECNFEESRVHVFTHDVISRNVVYSPMHDLVQTLTNYLTIQDSITNTLRNSEKVNVLISEKIDIKDQTLNGIQMLDDARLYMMKGSTPLQQYELGVRIAGARTDTVNLEREYALKQTNQSQAKLELTSIPPNSQVTPVTVSTPHTDALKETYRQYVLQCYAYFGVDLTQNTSSNDVDPSDSNECMNVTLICHMLQELLREAYSVCFKVEIDQVHVVLSSPKMQVRNVADIKTLWECGIFPGGELKKLFS